ncbi:hypothetical protein [Streptomyces sp. NPDC090994]|uniref:hypothetical protein n=1 Tax=Streptomyces sp. NPDC090994 TaxID=3365969 RepID=UPI0037FA03FF
MSTDTKTRPMPQFWYGLPHGYAEVDLDPTEEGVAELARQLRRLPPEARARADQTFRLYAMTVLLLRKQPVAVYALGVHPDAEGEPASSVLTISAVPSEGAHPLRVLAAMVTDSAGGDEIDGMRPVELPAGVGFLTERVRKTPAPGAPPAGREEPLEGTVWQGTVAVPEPRTSSIVVVQLVTSSVGLADDYRAVLLGTARTLSFTDPAAGEGRGSERASGSAARAMESDFG